MLTYIEERYDVITINGNCAAMSTLRAAGIADADILIGATMADEVNLLCCLAPIVLHVFFVANAYFGHRTIFTTSRG